jgi:hypothetical protein
MINPMLLVVINIFTCINHQSNIVAGWSLLVFGHCSLSVGYGLSIHGCIDHLSNVVVGCRLLVVVECF